MLRSATCPTRQGQGASCRFGNSNINHGETKKVGHNTCLFFCVDVLCLVYVIGWVLQHVPLY